MSVFGKYSSYYNLLYKDKDYAGEAEYIHKLIQKYSSGAKSILDLGCGTGRHDFLLVEKGYSVTGVDQSNDMLAVANAQLSTLKKKIKIETEIENKRSTSISTLDLNFRQGDIRTIRLNKQFDIIISLFHVMSYQTANKDIQTAFATAKSHLKPGGIFIFDCWYGPAVLTDRPAVRIKRLEDDSISVVRIAEPVMYPNRNIVDVNYTVFIKDKTSGGVEELKETHHMRYLFKPEIELFCAEDSFEIIGMKEWMTDKEPDMKSWSVCFVGRG